MISRANPSTPPRPQPQHSPDELEFAKRSLDKLVQDSRFFPTLERYNRIQAITEDCFDYGSIIGRGGFCEVRCAWLKHRSWGNRRRDDSIDIVPYKYAVKYLSPSRTTSSKVFQRGLADLVMEACFLSLLRHDNIIELHYVSEGSLEENYGCVSHQISSQGDDDTYLDANGTPPSCAHLFGYFLVLDLLHETLAQRIEKTYVPQYLLHYPLMISTSNTVSAPSQNNSARFHLSQRLDVATCIASALTYLHDNHRIIFRDIKPENIGFIRKYHPQCSCGYQRENGCRDECSCFVEVTKLFDFGLAKELKPKYRKSHPAYPGLDTYKLTGCTGSRRYMAPEVCFSQPYNEKADVYSFGILLYHVASLVTPFDGFSIGRHERYVLREGVRPDVKIIRNSFMGKKSPALSLDERFEEIEMKNRLLASRTTQYWPNDLPRLMEECWDCDVSCRPSMRVVTSKLQRLIDELIPRGTGNIGNRAKFSLHDAKGEAVSHHNFSRGGHRQVRGDNPPQRRQQQNCSIFSPLSPSFSFSGKRNKKNDCEMDTSRGRIIIPSELTPNVSGAGGKISCINRFHTQNKK